MTVDCLMGAAAVPMKQHWKGKKKKKKEKKEKKKGRRKGEKTKRKRGQFEQCGWLQKEK